ncbi:PblB [Streptococcus pneumoniae]|uniref:tail fiber domain-containing protein n=4 Tax=Streptococcus pneumoniae TaxID=1313 RepID=UPI0010DC64B0|nr:tail fiber domain-containing protein [Streptococcus pneumoniae]VIZ40216.1 PblB [Streptococcus pneumoniae]VJQ22446.1 PblB [Streptococcus pneumoniae]VJS08658.1 PblB [Streptococcus pneumoniae]VJY98752.1 PblB [Streptococcus pneumoniae]VKO94113.1 PblB [Streptococcus pneumoniae]
MDALTRRQFDRAMFAKERTLAIRVGDYASRDIKEASFEYGYIKGDTYKPGGTCAGSGKITFTSIITTFNKLDTLHPEIGLLVGDTYQWVKMGEYFINDIEIDRNRNTTTLELMDGMFKLNREYVTDLHFPAEVREVIQEICLKTGIELANDYFGISAMRYHIEQVPEGKKLSFRDMLSAMTQMIGMSCFFNREGKMEIRDLTESNITINADSYFLHGLTKSEIEYQISGITCKTDKKSLTVGMKTGRSLELDNVFMTQSALNDLYYKLKNLTYYPYNLNYQGHLLLEVGQWVTIQTNKKETFKVPVLSQSFTFKGGLRGRISADSKAGNDTQYSYEGTITKQIKQQDGVEAKIQAQIEAADKDFDQKVDKIKKDFNDQVELAKARAEEVKRELSDTINQRFNSFDNGPLKETKRTAEEALRNAGASTLLAQEAKRIGLDSVARLEAFKSQTTSAQTALSGDLDALKRTIANDIRPKQAQAEAEIAKQVEALSRTKNELAGASNLLAQEAKRIELDSVARLEAFKSQTTSAQTALSGDLDVLKRTIANDIRPKQAQAEAEIAKQVEVLSRTKNELAGVKSAQATYEETTTRRLSELTNLANGKASKSELTQTAEELSSKIASVQASGRNLFLNSLFKQDISKTGIWTTSTYTATIDSESKYLGHKALKIIGLNPSGRDGGNPKVTYPALGQFGKVIPGSTTNQDVTISFYAKANKNGIMLRSRLGNIGYKTGNVTLSTEIKRYVVHIPKGWTNESKQTTNEWLFNFNQEGTVWIWMPKFEISDVDTSYSEAPEDIEGQISTVESTFKQRANSLEAGVNRLTEGLRTKVDISALNVTAENIRQSVKSLETDTQNKLNQKLSQAEFEVRAGSIRQEILNATKDKASKSELTQTAEELSSKIASVQVGGINLLRNTASLLIGDRSKGCWMSASGGNGRAISVEVLDPPKKMIKNMIRVIENTNGGNKDLTQLVRLRIGEKYTISCYARIASDSPNANVNLLFRSWANNTDLNRKFQKSISHKNWQKYSFTFTADAIENSIQFGQSGAGIIEICAPKIESGTLATDYSEAPEDIEGQISTVESTFKQRANSLDAGVSRLTEGLRTKVDISALNVTAENIRQSVKSLETDTQNKLNQKLSQAEFEVRAGSIRQEILNATKDKASKSELTQTAEELASKIASVQVGGRNYIRGTKRMMLARGLWASGTFRPSGAGTAKTIDVSDSPATGFDKAIRLTSSNARDQIGIAQDGFYISQGTYTMSCWVKGRRGQKVKLQTYWQVNDNSGISPIFTLKDENWTKLSFTSARNRAGVASIGYVYLVNAEVGEYLDVLAPQLEDGSLATSSKEAPEDIEGQISTVESNFKQRADSLDAGVSRLTEGLRTKADISSLNVTAENIRQSVKSLETDTQNKLNQKLSQAEFEVRAGSIRQEILNATKDKADKTLVVSEAGKLREEFSKMKVGGRNLWIKSKTVGAVIEKLPENHVTGQKECYRLENNSTLTFNLEPDFSSRLYQKVTFSAWIKYENVVQGRNFWNVFNCFKHYLFRKNSETGVQSGPDYATLGMYKGSADWKYITFTYDYSEKTNFDQLKTSLRFNLEGATSGTAWVTGIKVEIGSVATDWSPAPEDGENELLVAKTEFKRTADGLSTKMAAVESYVGQDGQRREALQRYTREESARQATAVRELVNRDFVGKATYQEDVKGINQRIEAVKTSANKDIASQIASYRQSVDGKFTDISSQITTYKQDVGGQISGLSNRLTSSEQGTTTQISNLKTQVATNKDNAERQMGRISDQVSANKANADSQFANVTNQLARKVETTDFQRVKETSKLYERILGNTENGIADKVARMALTNQLFQVEVGKYSVSGPNLIKNSDFKNGTNEWGSTQNLGRLVKHSFYHNGQKDLMRLSNATKNENFLYSHRFNLERNTDYVLNFRGFNNSALASYDVYILGRRAGESDGFTIVKKVVSSKKLSTSRCEDVSVTFNSGEMDNAYIRFDNNGSSSGTADLYITEVDLYKGYKPRTWQPHPEDAVADANKKLEATQTKMTLLAGSWVVENINSAGDIISGINLGANGHNRFVGKLTHITGETLIDRAVIKSAMVDKLKTGNFEAGSVTTTILDAEAVTAEKLKVDDALIRKLTANDAFIDRLISKRIFSTKVESVISSSTFLEAYQGRIGGFTLGQFDQGGGRWISGVNQFSVGMGNGAGHGVRTAFWANWGNNWNYAGPKAWNVNTDGKMYCRNEVGFYDQVDFSNSSRANFYGNTTFSRSPVFSNGIELGSKDVLGDGWNPKGGRNAVVWWNQVGSGSVKYWMEQKSDRRLKENITDTAVKALDKINRLRMVAFDFIENKKHEEIGLIAQEAETIVPRIVSRDPENPDGYLHIDYTALVPYLIKAIQELNQKIEKMEKTIA